MFFFLLQNDAALVNGSAFFLLPLLNCSAHVDLKKHRYITDVFFVIVDAFSLSFAKEDESLVHSFITVT